LSQTAAADQLTADAITGAGLPEWLAARKLADLDTFRDLPQPDSNTMEDWRKTDVSRLDPRDYAVPAGPGPAAAAAAEELAAQGVVVGTLEEAAQRHSDLVQRYLEHEVVPAGAGKFAALNAAFWRGGVFVHVPRGVSAAVPIRAVFGQEGLAPGRPAILPRSLVVVEDGASLVFSDEYGAPEAPTTGGALSSAVAEVVVGDNASIQYLVLQEWPDDVHHIATHRIHLGRDSNAELVVAATGGELSKVYMEVAMLGPGSTARISGLVIGHGKQHFDYQSLQDHHAPNCVSDLLVKGALRDQAVSVYSGLIKIRKDAQHSDAYQANRNLLLSPKARADSIPKLEIEANDVRCTHGATVGQVDAEQLFYLQSRGFTPEEAQNTLVHGFFQPVIDRIVLEEVRARIHEAIDAELEGLDPEAAAEPGGQGTQGDPGVASAINQADQRG
jgi:Fe-S cluster assembly protein SufD